ncbi:Allantoicase [Fennellomyces sp. T-0311]|nr:Allantoicase [Fennellomyces sp. T-0311]
MHKRIDHNDINAQLGQCIDLASSAMGSTIVAVTDEFFAPATNMINPAPPVHCPGKFIDTGAWMDGWETKRHNAGYDWCIIKLGFAGVIRGFDIDTSYFTGNQAPAASVEATFCSDNDLDKAQWSEILPRVDLPPSCHNAFVLDSPTKVCTHVRINNYPDGGIARFRVYGQVTPLWPKGASEVVDLAYVGNGGRVVYATDEHYAPGNNILLPGRGANADDGWQTKRSRVPDHSDFAVIRLGDKGHILKMELDTSHFCGNYPNRIKLEATNSDAEVPESTAKWTTLVEPSSTGPNGLFYFDPAHTDKVFTHARITILPDGGFKRVRLYGVRQGAALPSLPLAAPNAPKRSVVAEPLTAEEYAPYGEVIEARKNVNITGANQGTAEKFHHVAKVTNAFPNNSGNLNLCVYHCRPAKELPFKVKLLERHPYSSQQFIPMTDGSTRGYLVVVALNNPDGSPDLNTLKAFIASSKQGISYRRGVWHHPMIALENETDFACLVHENGVPNDDCQETNVDEVVVQVPGYHTF